MSPKTAQASAEKSKNTNLMISAGIELTLDLNVKFDDDKTDEKPDAVKLDVDAFLQFENFNTPDKGEGSTVTVKVCIGDEPRTDEEEPPADDEDDGEKKPPKSQTSLTPTEKTDSGRLRDFVKAATKLDISRYGNVEELTFRRTKAMQDGVEATKTFLEIKADGWKAKAQFSDNAECSLKMFKLEVGPSKSQIAKGEKKPKPFTLDGLVRCFSPEAADSLKQHLKLGVVLTSVQFINVVPKGTEKDKERETAVQIKNGEHTILEVAKTSSIVHVRFALRELGTDVMLTEKSDGFVIAKFSGLTMRMKHAAVLYSDNPNQPIQMHFDKFQEEEDKTEFFDGNAIKFDTSDIESRPAPRSLK